MMMLREARELLRSDRRAARGLVNLTSRRRWPRRRGFAPAEPDEATDRTHCASELAPYTRELSEHFVGTQLHRLVRHQGPSDLGGS